MRGAEKALLLAVLERLRLDTESGGAGFLDSESNCEPDMGFPATTGKLYVAAMPAGWVYGPTHSTSGGVRDLIYGVNVAVVKRLGNVPRDRKRSVFLDNLDSLDAEVDRVFQAIDWKYEVTTAANAIILAETQSSQGFIKPLCGCGQVEPPRPAPPDMFAASGQQAAGMMRLIHFHGARRITTL